ncbi:DNA-directed RNA polymerase subunit A'' [Candidatus Woesearchaeota archaeon]|jgi:DNA-directed RNA polymerase subunit A"|nr:DNA-directed RNA polymerase subunit A'' [Candidatus Woesearchaeota archaeon]MBT4321611.1 DNA-directed RNA polymerase subunit A'' [Candidatus Woesearchaeota archaeon]MBT4631078.1 DNA-directed RNA polymerase subunit A'' [Candidatus Woesearchaeota archaeon]
MVDIYLKYKDELPGKIIEDVKKEAEINKLTSAEVKKVLEEVKHEYVNSLISPGESVGIITAESFGEPGTQMTLNVFHMAGVAEVQVTRGLPRLIEIFDARKEPSTPSMNVYLKSEYTKDEKTIRKVASFIKQMTLQEISSEFSLNMMKAAVEVTLNSKKLRDFGFKKADILETLKVKLKDVNVKECTKGFVLESSKEEGDLTGLYRLRQKAKEVIVRGISGITQVLPTKKDGKYVIQCAGTNLKEVFKLKEIEPKSTVSNNLFEIASILGIEAAKQAIMNECLAVLENQGLDIDIRHVMFLSELMTHTGNVKGITRGGISGEKESVLARASFETPIKHIVDASITGEVDKIRSVIENVMINQPIPMGTGLPGLVAQIKKEKVGKKK